MARLDALDHEDLIGAKIAGARTPPLERRSISEV